jgi:hypothetical protein
MINRQTFDRALVYPPLHMTFYARLKILWGRAKDQCLAVMGERREGIHTAAVHPEPQQASQANPKTGCA